LRSGPADAPPQWPATSPQQEGVHEDRGWIDELQNLRGALLGLLCSAALAQPLPADPLERRCWLAHTAQRTAVDLREPVAVHFSNLRNGYQVRSPFWVEFGVRGMGVIPAGNPNEQAGHHHLLIDTPLPLNHQAAIPFSDTHKHFGKGQTGAEISLPPGRTRCACCSPTTRTSPISSTAPRSASR
jgi:hypothetical protein